MKKFIIITAIIAFLSVFRSMNTDQNNIDVTHEKQQQDITEANPNNIIRDERNSINFSVEATNITDLNQNKEAIKTEDTGVVSSFGEEADENKTDPEERSSDALASQEEQKGTTEATIEKKESDPIKSSTPIVTKPPTKKTAPTAKIAVTGAPVSRTNTTETYSIKKLQDYDYKEIDFSDCKTINDVVNVLQKSGYTSINVSNIKDISSLEDILERMEEADTNITPTKPATTTQPDDTAVTKPSPTAKPSPTTKPSTNTDSNTSDTGNSSYADQVLQLVNRERAKVGVSPLTTTTILASASNLRAKETVQSFSHTRPNGDRFSSVLGEFNITWCTAGENIAYGQSSPQEVVADWMDSPGHRENILDKDFNKIGIGVVQANNRIYWSQLFTD